MQQLCSEYNINTTGRATLQKLASLAFIQRPTKRAPDAGDSAAISSSFLHLIIFLVGRLRRPCPSAGNAIRWVASLQNYQ